MSNPTEPMVPVEHFATTAALQVPVAGLLTARPDLHDTELTVADWQDLLDQYLGQPVDAPADDPEPPAGPDPSTDA